MAEFFTGKNVMIVSQEPWDHLFVSKHHYAIELSQKNKVFFVNPPGNAYTIKPTRYDNLWEISYPGFLPGLRFFPDFVQKYLIRRKYEAIQRTAKVRFDCVWSFDNSVFFDFSALPSDIITISHIVDYSQNFQLSKAASTAKLCLAVTQNIVHLLRKFNPNTFLIPHGIAIHRHSEMEVTLPGKKSIKAIFAGNLDRKHFDKEVLWNLAGKFTQVDFVFFGSGGTDWPRQENMHYPGIVPSELLHNYLKKADVLLLPYKVDDYPLELTNSHKILEYLSSGKTILSSFLQDYADKQYLMKMVETNKDFPIMFEEIINNLPDFNNDEKQAQRKKYAEDNSYTKRLGEIENFVRRVADSSKKNN